MSDPIKTIAVMIANRLHLAAAEHAEQRGTRLHAALEDFCASLKGEKRKVMEKHNPKIFTDNDL